MENVQKKMMGLKTLKYPIALIISLISVFLYSFLAKDSDLKSKERDAEERKVDLGNTSDVAALPSEKYEIKESEDLFNTFPSASNSSGEQDGVNSISTSTRSRNYDEYQNEKDKQVESGLAKKRMVNVGKYQEVREKNVERNKSGIVLYRDGTKSESKTESDVVKNFDKKFNDLARENNEGKDNTKSLPYFTDVNPSSVVIESNPQNSNNSRFYGLQKNVSKSDKLAQTKGNKKLIQAQTIENRTILNGQDVRILVREDFVYNGKEFKSGATLSGKASIVGNRLMVDFQGLIEHGVYYTISANLFDTDAQLGLNFHVDENDAIKQANKQSTSSSMLNQVNPLLIYNPTGNIAQQASTQIVGSAINQSLNAASNLMRSKGTIPKVYIKSGQICYLNLK
jgi:hypothetical protein